MEILIGLVLLVLYIAVAGFVVSLVLDNVKMPDAFKQLITLICVVSIIAYVIAAISGHAPLPKWPFR